MECQDYLFGKPRSAFQTMESALITKPPEVPLFRPFTNKMVNPSLQHCITLESQKSPEKSSQKKSSLKKSSRKKLPQKKSPQKKSPQKKSPQQMVPQQMVPQQKMPQKKLPQQMVPQQKLPQQKLPQRMVTQQMVPQQMVPQQKLPQQMVPQQKLPQQKLPQQMVPPQQHFTTISSLPAQLFTRPKEEEFEDHSKPCLCHRPLMTIYCQCCSYTGIGRTRRRCERHPQNIYLMDIDKCPQCMAFASNLGELEAPKESFVSSSEDMECQNTLKGNNSDMADTPTKDDEHYNSLLISVTNRKGRSVCYQH